MLRLVVWRLAWLQGNSIRQLKKPFGLQPEIIAGGGAYDSNLLSCESIAILPEGMSKERFEWLSKVAGETIKTPGSESNVKEIFDKCWELRNSGQDLVIFNQFEEFGNYMWHYEVTGRAMAEVLGQVMQSTDNYRGIAMTTGSAGSIACGDYLKQPIPHQQNSCQ